MSHRLDRLVVLALVLGSCFQEGAERRPDTAWLKVCDDDGACAQGSCICGVCTKTCDGRFDCAGSDFPGICTPASSEPGRVQCRDEQNPPEAFCLPSCEGATCSGPFSCYGGGVCVMAGGDGDGDGGDVDSGAPFPEGSVEVDGVTFTPVMEQTSVAVQVSPFSLIERRRCGSSRLEKNVEGESILLVDDRPPSHDNPGYYLDGRYFEPSTEEACDATDCLGTGGLVDRFPIGLAYEYRKIGSAPAPAGAPNVGELVDMIETRAYSGDLYVYFNYSSGFSCEDREVRLELSVPEEGVCCPIADGGCTLDGPTGGWARTRDECRPAPRPSADDAWIAGADPHGCTALEYHDEICCGCRSGPEETSRACDVEEPCGQGSAELLADGSHSVAWDEVGCILAALATVKVGRYVHETSSTFADGTMTARHTFLVGEDRSIRYARVERSTSVAGTHEAEDRALLCRPADSDLTGCRSAIASDRASEAAWLCAFGDGTASAPSHLAWLDRCSNVAPTCE